MKIKKRSNAIRIPPIKKAIKVIRKSSDGEEESTVSKAIQNVKKVFEKRNAEKPKLLSSRKIIKKRKVFVPVKEKTVRERKITRGIVYLGHIPHGFYEEQMTEYFKQFGQVTRVRVTRSRNTGRSRGYGYVEFMLPDVAKIAAETMNNYLMCGRLLKATYIPPEKQHIRYFAGKPWTEETYPKLRNRSSVTEIRNKDIDHRKHSSFVQSTKDKLSNLERKLKGKGFDLKFTPVDDTKS
ncbi:MKI67 FHA domain-interacting nucleolar phosphoprotein-like [Osmia bicornis bicornis]|uniref:MKI67 FHA domain-interacting nucleolar phosphoprotein-like n=1 Tax=Osmia bicornis bicornis TaxID=1437191 RepID=UPI0010F75EEE|nr:MKI67 FHA domain-interacting nucleolar phosphoprotein-like [Osmia bicornis bicornis]